MWHILLSLLFPPTAHEQTLARVDRLLPNPVVITLGSGQRVHTCARYDTPEIRTAILLNKQHGHARATHLLAELLADIMLEELSDAMLWHSHNYVITVVPLSRRQYRERGFNQVTRIIDALPSELRALADTTVLVKPLNTVAQKKLSREARLSNVRGAFAVRAHNDLHGVRIILVDDVITTGATLAEATRVLEDRGAHVTAVALARA